MMQVCRDNDIAMQIGNLSREEGFEWNLEDMNTHQEKMLKIIFS